MKISELPSSVYMFSEDKFFGNVFRERLIAAGMGVQSIIYGVILFIMGSSPHDIVFSGLIPVFAVINLAVFCLAAVFIKRYAINFFAGIKIDENGNILIRDTEHVTAAEDVNARLITVEIISLSLISQPEIFAFVFCMIARTFPQNAGSAPEILLLFLPSVLKIFWILMNFPSVERKYSMMKIAAYRSVTGDFNF